MSKATIASRLSLTPEYFSRVLHELESRGLIELDRRDIRIPDARKLSSYHLEAADSAMHPASRRRQAVS